MVTECYGPLVPIVHHKGGPLDPVVVSIAAKHNATPSQVLLKWSIQRGNVVVTTSSKEERLKEYLGLEGVTLSAEEIEKISKAGESDPFRQFWQPQYKAKV